MNNIHPETEKEFDESIGLKDWGGKSFAGGTLIKPQDVKRFISTHFIDRRVLEEELEKMKTNGKCYCKSHPEHNCGITSNETLQDLKEKLLTKPKE